MQDGYCLCRCADAAALKGATNGPTEGKAVVTVGNDGVICYDIETQTKECTWPLGARYSEIAVSAVWDSLSEKFYAIAKPAGSGEQRQNLICWPRESKGNKRSKSKADVARGNAPAVVTLSDAPSHALRKNAFALYPVTRDVLAAPARDNDVGKTAGNSKVDVPGGVVLVYDDGSVALHGLEGNELCCSDAADGATILASACALGNPLHAGGHAPLLVAVAYHSSAAGLKHGSKSSKSKPPAAASPGQAYTLDVWQFSCRGASAPQGPEQGPHTWSAVHTHHFQACPPTAGGGESNPAAAPHLESLTVAPGNVTLVWSNTSFSLYTLARWQPAVGKGAQGATLAGARLQPQQHNVASVATAAHGTGGSAPSTREDVRPPPGTSKKRSRGKEVAPQEGTTGRRVAAAAGIPGTPFLAVATLLPQEHGLLSPSGIGHTIALSVVDTTYGCVLTSATAKLGGEGEERAGVGLASLSLEDAQGHLAGVRLSVAPGYGEEEFFLLATACGEVVVFEVDVPPSLTLDMVLGSLKGAVGAGAVAAVAPPSMVQAPVWRGSVKAAGGHGQDKAKAKGPKMQGHVDDISGRLRGDAGVGAVTVSRATPWDEAPMTEADARLATFLDQLREVATCRVDADDDETTAALLGALDRAAEGDGDADGDSDGIIGGTGLPASLALRWDKASLESAVENALSYSGGRAGRDELSLVRGRPGRHLAVPHSTVSALVECGVRRGTWSLVARLVERGAVPCVGQCPSLVPALVARGDVCQIDALLLQADTLPAREMGLLLRFLTSGGSGAGTGDSARELVRRKEAAAAAVLRRCCRGVVAQRAAKGGRDEGVSAVATAGKVKGSKKGRTPAVEGAAQLANGGDDVMAARGGTSVPGRGAGAGVAALPGQVGAAAACAPAHAAGRKCGP
eukprot:jgi/Mesvir1/16174/Mv08439-RA.1